MYTLSLTDSVTFMLVFLIIVDIWQNSKAKYATKSMEVLVYNYPIYQDALRLMCFYTYMTVAISGDSKITMQSDC